MPLYPFIVLEVGSAFRVPTFRNYNLVNPQVGSPRDLGVRHLVSELKEARPSSWCGDGTQEDLQATARLHVGGARRRPSSPARIYWGGGTHASGGPLRRARK
jgi:hypothetical protein